MKAEPLDAKISAKQGRQYRSLQSLMVYFISFHFMSTGKGFISTPGVLAYHHTIEHDLDLVDIAKFWLTFFAFIAL